jgi:hypothetical protein
MRNRQSGDGLVGISFIEETRIGVAYEREREPSEFGLPEGYEDPQAYHGKTPPCDRSIGVGRP